MKQGSEQPIFSARSAASLKREAGLREQLANIEKQIGYAQRKLREEEAIRDSMQKSLAKGTPHVYITSLDQHLVEIEQVNLRISSLEKFKANLEANIEAECVIPPHRAGIQAQLAERAAARLKLDATIEKLLDGLRAALTKREEQTAELRGLAERIEFEGDFDERRFTALRNALVPVLPLSERWCAQLLGTEGKGLVRAVARVQFQIAEQLHYAGIFEPGDELLLTQEEFDARSRPHFTAVPGEGYFEDKLRDLFTPRQVCAVAQFQQFEDKDAAVDSWWAEDECDWKEARQSWELAATRALWDRKVENTARSWGWPESRARAEVEKQYGARP